MSIINFSNGTYNLINAKFEPNVPNINFPYTPDCRHKKEVINFIERVIGNASSKKFLMFLAACLLNDVDGLHIFHSNGAAGVSRMIELIMNAFGSYSIIVSPYDNRWDEHLDVDDVKLFVSPALEENRIAENVQSNLASMIQRVPVIMPMYNPSLLSSNIKPNTIIWEFPKRFKNCSCNLEENEHVIDHSISHNVRKDGPWPKALMSLILDHVQIYLREGIEFFEQRLI